MVWDKEWLAVPTQSYSIIFLLLISVSTFSFWTVKPTICSCCVATAAPPAPPSWSLVYFVNLSQLGYCSSCIMKEVHSEQMCILFLFFFVTCIKKTIPLKIERIYTRIKAKRVFQTFIVKMKSFLKAHPTMTYMPGDSFDVLCPNRASEVDAVLLRLGLQDQKHQRVQLAVRRDTQKRG